jgi:hypothetical protein
MLIYTLGHLRGCPLDYQQASARMSASVTGSTSYQALLVTTINLLCRSHFWGNFF